jgi:hypothetical protein
MALCLVRPAVYGGFWCGEFPLVFVFGAPAAWGGASRKHGPGAAQSTSNPP